MRKLLNTLFVTSEDAYAALDGENIIIRKGEETVARFPFVTLESIVMFSYSGASPALMGACAKRGIDLVFCSPQGRFLARTCGESRGNVLLRRQQYRIADNNEESCKIAACSVFGKVSNARASVDRTLRDHPLRIDTDKFRSVSEQLKEMLSQILVCSDLDTLRGLEGNTAKIYFSCFDDMILGDKDNFFFRDRNRRPPRDNVNAMLSFIYTLLANDCASALESVGLDSYVGFMHRDKPGRTSLALDLMEELRPCLADRFVLSLVNNRIMNPSDFQKQENGAVLLTDNARKKFIKNWQERKKDEITHPYLKEKMPWGLVPYVQALLMARYLRNDLDAYPCFIWK